MRSSLEALLQSFAANADHAAIADASGTISFRECSERIGHISSQLSLFPQAKRVAVWGRNSSDYLLLLTALWLRNQTAFPLSTRLPVNQLNSLLKRSDADLLITLAEHHPEFNIETKFLPPFEKVPSALPGENAAVENPATCLATSGSSGTPKIAVHSLDNHYCSALGSNVNILLQTGDCWLLSLPLYHVGGIAIWMRCLLAGACVYVPGEGETLEEILQYQHITHLSLVSTQLQRLLENAAVVPKLRRLKSLLLGGSAIPQPLLQHCFDENMPIHTSYGSTEMSSQITTTGAGERGFTSGKLLPHRELTIEKDGEILVRGKTLFRGYLEKGRINGAVDNDGWFHTRDSGCWDENGNLIVTGRMDNMFISGGENIQPAEIEKALEALPGIIHAVVVAVDDKEFGKRPAAFVQLMADIELNEDDLKTDLRKTLAGYKIPKRILLLPDDITANSLKPDRQRLQDLAKLA